MITEILSGMLLGIAVTLVAAYMFVFQARRRGWLEVRVAPGPKAVYDSADRAAIAQLADRLDDLRGDFDHLEGLLAPYLDRATLKNPKNDGKD